MKEKGSYMEKTDAEWVCSLLCRCPHCDKLMDLLDNTGKNDVIEQVNNKLKPLETNTEFEIEMTCEECDGIFIVNRT